MVATTDYGGTVPAIVARGNRAGTQFHVEKARRSACASCQFPALDTRAGQHTMTRRTATAGTIHAERVQQMHEDDLHALCDATNAAILDGGGFGWLAPPRVRRWNGISAVSCWCPNARCSWPGWMT